jgi:uncharacterized protein YneF (UPF0154 family)
MIAEVIVILSLLVVFLLGLFIAFKVESSAKSH